MKIGREINEEEHDNNPLLPWAVIGCLGICVIAAITGVIAWANNVGFDTWFYMFIATLAAYGLLIWSMSS